MGPSYSDEPGEGGSILMHRRLKHMLDRLQAIRLAASVALGIAPTGEEAIAKRLVPFVGFAPDRSMRVLLASRA
jgi:hypothetical protein